MGGVRPKDRLIRQLAPAGGEIEKSLCWYRPRYAWRGGSLRRELRQYGSGVTTVFPFERLFSKVRMCPFPEGMTEINNWIALQD